MSSSQKITYLISAINKTQQPFKEVEGQLKTLNKARLEANTLVFAEQRAQQFLLSTYRQKYAAVSDTLGLMRNIGSIGTQIISIVNSENLSQMRLRDSLLDVDEAQRRVNTALALYGADSPAYQQAWDDLTDAQNRYKDASNAADWQDLGVAVSIIGLIGTVGELIIQLGELNALYGVAAAAAAGALALPAAAAAVVVGGLAALGASGGPETPGNFSGIMPEGMDPLTKADIEAGLDYVDKYAVWRERQILGGTDAPSSPGETQATAGLNINVQVETNADPDQIADAAIRAYQEYERSRR